jgi:protein-tyrosine phosphatase
MNEESIMRKASRLCPLLITAVLLAFCVATVFACAASTEKDGNSGLLAPCDGRILEQEVTNARDLGGQMGANGQAAACAKVFRGGELTRLTDVGCQEFENLAIKTVVDLRQRHVQTSDPPPTCVSERAGMVSAAMAKLLPDTPEHYLALFGETDAIRLLFETLGANDNYPVYFHCVIGRDRASFAAALVLSAIGVERSAIVDEFELSANAGVAVKTECIEAVLDEIEGRGGIETFLMSAGVDQTDLEALRAVMLPN